MGQNNSNLHSIQEQTQTVQLKMKQEGSFESSQIETSDACVQSMFKAKEAEISQQQKDQAPLLQEQMKDNDENVQICLKQQQKKQNNNESRSCASATNLQQNGLKTLQRQESGPSSHRSQMEDNYAQLQHLYNQLLAYFLPADQPNLIKLRERRRTLILWLKQKPESHAEKEREKKLSTDGFEVYSTEDVSSLFERYERSSQQLYFQIWVMFSYSEYYDNMEIIRELNQYFLVEKRLQKLFLVAPPEGPKLENFKMHLDKIETNHHITQLNYQIELIRLKLKAEEDYLSSFCSFTNLQYWQDREHLATLLNTNTYSAFCLKTKINLQGFLNIGRSIIQNIADNPPAFKTLLYHYISFQQSYSEANQLKKSEREYLEKVGLLMLEDPIRFYVQSKHNRMMDRLLRFVGDRLQNVSVILLPLALLSDRIKQEYQNERQKRRYKNEFRCYCELQLSPFQLSGFEVGHVIENLGFIKASLQPLRTSLNTQIAINVVGHSTSAQHQNGYCFVSQLNQAKLSYFAGYDWVLFNILNSFKVTGRRYDSRDKKHMIELQYGYVSRQIQLKTEEDYIPKQQQQLRYRPAPKQSADIHSIIKYQSNCKFLSQIVDFGDSLSLTGEYGQAIGYYQQLFNKKRTDIKGNLVLLAKIHEKKALNFQFKGKFTQALDNFYQAFNFVHRGAITPQLENIESRTVQLMQVDHQPQKIVTFCESIIRSGRKQSDWQFHSLRFKLRVNQWLAEAYFNLICEDYQLTGSDSRVMHHWQTALEHIAQLGEYDQDVAKFYLLFGRYFLIIRQPVQALTYINKSLLILKTICTQHHPILCPIYQRLAVGYLQTHDYTKANFQLTQALAIYSRYFSTADKRNLVCLQLKAVIARQSGQHQLARSTWETQIQLLQQIYKNRKQGQVLDKADLITSDAIAIYRNFFNKQRQSEEKPVLSINKQLLSITHCYAQMGQSYCCEYDWEKAVDCISEAIKVCEWQLKAQYVYCIELHLLRAQYLIRVSNDKKLKESIKNASLLIQKKRLQKQPISIKYHLLVAQVHSSNPQAALNSLLKAREVAGQSYGSNTPEYCLLLDQAGRQALKNQKVSEATSYFKETYEIRNKMLININLNRHLIQLYGNDFEDYQAKVKLQLCYSLENDALMQLAKGNLKLALESLESCLEKAKEIAGQFHSFTAHVYTQLAKLHLLLKDKDKLPEVVKCYNLALSVFQNMAQQPLNELLQTYEGLASARESLNNLGECIELWGKVIRLLRKDPILANKVENALNEFKRIAQVICEHENQNYFRMCYYILSNTFEEEKKIVENHGQIQYPPAEAQIVHQILEISKKLRAKIELHIEEQSQEHNPKEYVRGQHGFSTLEEIKLKLQQRKMRREAFKRKN